MNHRVLLVVLLCSLIPACKKQVRPPVSSASGVSVATRTPETSRPSVEAALQQNFARVYFEYDSARLTSEAMRALDENARILQRHVDVKVEIQGHCDERGTTDYNLALGQRRAAAVHRYLASTGVAASRIPIVSFGEEHPAATGADERAWAQNRRAEFRVLWGEVAAGTAR